MASIKRFLEEKDGLRILGRPPIDQLATTSVQPAPPLRSDTSDPSSTASNQSSTAPSNQPSPTVFSKNWSVSSKATSAPSLRDDPLNQQLVTMSIFSQQHGHELPCILNGIFHCDAEYPRSDYADWLSHSLAHYCGADPPNHAMCIFCPRTFDSTNPLKCWRSRMRHIAGHFATGWTLQNSRPDFKVLEDMVNKDCLSRERYVECTGGTERPFVDGLRSPNWEPEEVVERRLADQRAENQVVVTSSRHELRNKTRPTKGSGRPRRVEVKNPTDGPA